MLFSGTGKTATFSISILQQIDTTLNECQALILAPTRELAQQIQKVSSNFQNKFKFMLSFEILLSYSFLINIDYINTCFTP